MSDSDRDHRRAAALEAARRLLASDGVSALSMRRLAGAASMAVNTLYAMFGTRDGILQALVDDAIASRVAALTAGEEPSGSALDRLDGFVTASLRHAIDHADAMKPMYRAAGQLRSLRRRANRVGLEMFVAQLERAVGEGWLRDDVDVVLLAEMQMQVVNETSLAWALDELPDAELEAQCRYMLALALSASAAPPHAVEMQRRLHAASVRLRQARGQGATDAEATRG